MWDAFVKKSDSFMCCVFRHSDERALQSYFYIIIRTAQVRDLNGADVTF